LLETVFDEEHLSSGRSGGSLTRGYWC
jgi:hypothetical protein